jgi:hypothetical protein
VRKAKLLAGLSLALGIFLFTYAFLDSGPHGLYGDDEAKKVRKTDVQTVEISRFQLELRHLETKLKSLESDLAVRPRAGRQESCCSSFS